MFTTLATILGLLFTFSGSGKVQKKPMALAAAEKLGYTKSMVQIGALEMLGGIAAVVFSRTDYRVISVLAIVGLNLVMAGAVAFHVKAKDFKGTIPAIVLFVLGCVALATIPA